MTPLRTLVVVMGLSLAVTSGALAAGQTANALTTENIEAEEATFGDLTTDALCDAAGSTIALVPAVVFKQGTIPAGQVTQQDIASLLYDPNESWAVLSLTGAQIRQALERSVSFAPTPRTFFLQVSGLTLVYDPDAMRGRRIKSLRAGFTEIDDAASYEVAMPESLAAGGSGYFTIFDGARRVRTGTEGAARLIDRYITARGSVSYTGQGRIIVGG